MTLPPALEALDELDRYPHEQNCMSHAQPGTCNCGLAAHLQALREALAPLPGDYAWEMTEENEPQAPNQYRIFRRSDPSYEATVCELWSGEQDNEKVAQAICDALNRPAALAPARFRVSMGDHHAEIEVSQTAPAAYHQGMVETVVSEAMRRALAARPLRWTGQNAESKTVGDSDEIA
jgi:hypothetical protein